MNIRITTTCNFVHSKFTPRLSRPTETQQNLSQGGTNTLLRTDTEYTHHAIEIIPPFLNEKKNRSVNVPDIHIYKIIWNSLIAMLLLLSLLLSKKKHKIACIVFSFAFFSCFHYFTIPVTTNKMNYITSRMPS